MTSSSMQKIYYKRYRVISWEPAEEDKAHDIIKYAKDILQKVQNFQSSTQIPNEDLALANLLKKLR